MNELCLVKRFNYIVVVIGEEGAEGGILLVELLAAVTLVRVVTHLSV